MTLKASEMPTLSLLYEQGSIPSPRTPDGSDPDGHKYTANASFNDKICLIQHDITKLEVDAIVNAANRRLMGGGGVDGAIHAAALRYPGDDGLYNQCEEHNGCDTGNAKVTDGFALPAKRIIHAVGPVFSQFREEECRNQLQSCYRRCLEIAVGEGHRSIAFSALSTGIYGYPSVRASEAALETVREFLESGKADEMEHIIFCNFMDKDVDAYYGVIAHYFPRATAADEVEPKSASTDENDATDEIDDASKLPNAPTASTDEIDEASKLPDAPTAEPEDTTASMEPTAKKQKTGEQTADIEDEDFVVIEKDDALGMESPKK